MSQLILEKQKKKRTEVDKIKLSIAGGETGRRSKGDRSRDRRATVDSP